MPSEWTHVQNQLPQKKKFVLCIGERYAAFIGAYVGDCDKSKYEICPFFMTQHGDVRKARYWMDIPPAPTKKER